MMLQRTHRYIISFSRRFLSSTSDPQASRTNAEEQARLKRELGRLLLGGGLQDIRAASKDEDSKVFQTEVLDEAKQLPLSLKTLTTIDGKEVNIPQEIGKSTALLLAFNQLGWSMLDGWRAAVPAKMDVIQLSVVEGWGARLFKGSMTTSLKTSVPSQNHDIVSLWVGPFEKERAALEIENRAVGYAFVVDSVGIRLRGSGKCTDRDKALLHAFIKVK